MSTVDSFASMPSAVLRGLSTEAKNRAAAQLEARVTRHLDAQVAQQFAAVMTVDAMIAVAGLTQLEAGLIAKYPNAAERIHLIANTAVINLAVRVQEA